MGTVSLNSFKTTHIKKTKKCEKSSISKPVNAVTKSVPSSGKSSPTNTVSTQPVPTMATLISNSRGSTSTTTKPPAANTSPELSSSISSLVPWTLFDPVHSVKSSDPTTLSSVNPVLVTTGPKVTTLKALNLSTQSSMSGGKKPNPAIASKVSNLPTLSV